MSETKAERERREKNDILRHSCSIGVQPVMVWATGQTVGNLSRCLVSTDLGPWEGTGLREQLMRSLISIPSNHAEGIGRSDPQDLIRFMKIARGSAYEAFAQCLLLGRDDITVMVKEICDEVDQFLIDLIPEKTPPECTPGEPSLGSVFRWTQ